MPVTMIRTNGLEYGIPRRPTRRRNSATLGAPDLGVKRGVDLLAIRPHHTVSAFDGARRPASIDIIVEFGDADTAIGRRVLARETSRP